MFKVGQLAVNIDEGTTHQIRHIKIQNGEQMLGFGRKRRLSTMGSLQMKDSNREAFEELIDIEIIISEGFKFNPNINQYYHPDHTNHRLSYAYLMGAWMVWQEKAQAVPEGFVLVPKEPTDIEIESIKEKHWDMRGCQLCKSDYIDLYKAMIEAQEQK